MNISEFKDILEAYFSSQFFDIIIDDSVLKITYRGREKEFFLKEEELNRLNDRLKKNKSGNYFNLFFDEKYYEVMLVSDYVRYVKEGELSVVDTVNHINYECSKMSNELALSLLLNKSSIIENPSIITMHLKIDKIESTNVLDLFTEIFLKYKYISLKITTSNNISLNKIKSYALSYTYSYMYNMQLPMSIYNDIQFGTDIEMQTIRNIENNFDSPKRTYNPELLEYYNEAISSTILSHQYLSFYHILEYFYEKIFSEDQIKKVKEIITDVSFSYKNDKEIVKLIKAIQQRTMDKDVAINEKKALALLIQKHIKQDDLKTRLIERNGEEFLAVPNNKVSFSDGNAIIFSEDESQFVKTLTERIYKTRNSIVHSKESFAEGNKNNKYKRIKDDKELLQEIALIQVMAEIMINEDSKPI
ncbi:MAG: hypothetical protein IKO34_07980 [Bacteroidales bacterium]|nr:hypothetical protein [Bacteroidales bacterium]